MLNKKLMGNNFSRFAKKIIAGSAIFTLISTPVVYAADSNSRWNPPSWTAVDKNGNKLCCKIDIDGTKIELPTYDEAYANLNYDSVPDKIKPIVLKCRRNIVFGNQSWTVNGQVKIVDKDGTVHDLPEFKDLFPNWDLKQLCTEDKTDTPASNSALSSGDVYLSVKSEENAASFYSFDSKFAGNVYLPVQGEKGNAPSFYSFNSNGATVYSWASTLPMNTKVNIGFNNEDTSSSIGWVPNLSEGDSASVQTIDGTRYSVRASATDRAGTAYMNVSQ